MSKRRRLNLSLRETTYNRLCERARRSGYRTACALVVGIIGVLLDRERDEQDRVLDIPEDIGATIDRMFQEFSNSQPQPDGTVPVRRRRHSVNDDKPLRHGS